MSIHDLGAQRVVTQHYDNAISPPRYFQTVPPHTRVQLTIQYPRRPLGMRQANKKLCVQSSTFCESTVYYDNTISLHYTLIHRKSHKMLWNGIGHGPATCSFFQGRLRAFFQSTQALPNFFFRHQIHHPEIVTPPVHYQWYTR